MAKDIAQAIAQATNNKGVAGWSLKTDDNATVDPTINWQEGQAPSTVNNSARAMMTRIREEHDLIDNRIKGIENGWGSRFLYVELGSYTLKDNKDGSFDLNMVISNKLTDEQYTDFKARKLFLAVNWRSDIEKNPVYKSITTLDVISLSLSIPTASTTHLWELFVNSSSLGTFDWGYPITLHELAYISNNIMEYVAHRSMAGRAETVRSIPMHRSYIDFTLSEVKDRYDQEITIKISWYYISPCEIILTVEPTGPNGSPYFNDFTYDLGVDWDNLTFLDNTTWQGVANVLKLKGSQMSFVMASYVANGGYYTVNLPKKWDGIRYRFHAKLTTDAHFKLYPMNVIPEQGKTYPIIT